jgi:uncharacterized membrane protein
MTEPSTAEETPEIEEDAAPAPAPAPAPQAPPATAAVAATATAVPARAPPAAPAPPAVLPPQKKVGGKASSKKEYVLQPRQTVRTNLLLFIGSFFFWALSIPQFLVCWAGNLFSHRHAS